MAEFSYSTVVNTNADTVVHRLDFHVSRATPFMGTKSERSPQTALETESGAKWIGAMSD